MIPWDASFLPFRCSLHSLRPQNASMANLTFTNGGLQYVSKMEGAKAYVIYAL